jgi:hypothetical protein
MDNRMRSMIEVKPSSTLVEKFRQLRMSLMKTIEGLTVTDLTLSVCHLRHVKTFAVVFSMTGHAGEALVLGWSKRTSCL